MVPAWSTLSSIDVKVARQEVGGAIHILNKCLITSLKQQSIFSHCDGVVVKVAVSTHDSTSLDVVAHSPLDECFHSIGTCGCRELKCNPVALIPSITLLAYYITHIVILTIGLISRSYRSIVQVFTPQDALVTSGIYSQ